MQTASISELSAYAPYPAQAAENIAASSDFAQRLALAMAKERAEKAEALERAKAEYEAYLEYRVQMAEESAKAEEEAAAGGSKGSASGLESLFGSKENVRDALLMMCAMMSANAGNIGSESGSSLLGGGSGEMSMRLMSALLTLSEQDQSGVRREVMDSQYDQDVLDEVDSTVFRSNLRTGDIPYEAWRPSDPAITSEPSNRSPGLYRAVIDQFGVETNERYKVGKKGQGDTYCNIFLWDVTKAMGAQIPHYTDPATGAPLEYPDTAGATRMTANRMYDWMHQYGQDNGWRRTNAAEAQAYANSGRPAVTLWKNESGGHGHVQVVSPSKDGSYDPRRGVTVAQAGRRLYDYANITDVYGSKRMDEIAYFVHA